MTALRSAFPDDQWNRLRRLIFVLACAGLVLASTGVLVKELFHQPTTIKYGVTVVTFGFLAVVTTAKQPLRVIVAMAVFTAPIDAVFKVQGAQLTPLMVIDLAGLFVAMPRVSPRGTPIKFAAVAFVLLCLPAIVQADLPGHWVFWLATTVATGWLAFLVAAEPGGVRYVAGAVVLSGLFQAVLAIYEFRTKHQLNLYGASGSQAANGETFFLYGRLLRPSGTLPDPIGLGQTLCLFLPLIVCLAAGVRKLVPAVLLIAAAGLVGLGLALSLSRLSIVGGGVGLLLTLILMPGGSRLRTVVLVAVVAAVVVALALAFGGVGLRARFDSIFNPTAAHVATQAGDVARTHIWSAAERIGNAHLLTGVGFGNVPQYLPRYGVPVTSAANAQNTPLQFLDEGGIPALIGLLGLIVAALVSLWQAFGTNRLWVAGCFAALVGTLLTWSTDVEIRFAQVSSVVAILLALIAALAVRARTIRDGGPAVPA